MQSIKSQNTQPQRSTETDESYQSISAKGLLFCKLTEGTKLEMLNGLRFGKRWRITCQIVLAREGSTVRLLKQYTLRSQCDRGLQ